MNFVVLFFLFALCLGEPTPPKEDVQTNEKLIERLGGVMGKLYEQVQNDELVLKAFKNKAYEQEVGRTNVELGWPAIKELVQSEVNAHKKSIENEVAQFKMEMLDMVQKGLDSLRTQLRSSFTQVPAKQSTQPEAAPQATAASEHFEKKEVYASQPLSALHNRLADLEARVARIHSTENDQIEFGHK